MTPNMIKRISVIAVLLLSTWGTTAKAVCLNKHGVAVDPSKHPVISWATEFKQASVVLIGTVAAQQNIPDPKEPDSWAGTLYKLKVESFLKGKPSSSIEVFSPNDSGRLSLTTGVRYLLFLHDQGGRLTTDSCGNSAKLVYP